MVLFGFFPTLSLLLSLEKQRLNPFSSSSDTSSFFPFPSLFPLVFKVFALERRSDRLPAAGKVATVTTEDELIGFTNEIELLAMCDHRGNATLFELPEYGSRAGTDRMHLFFVHGHSSGGETSRHPIHYILTPCSAARHPLHLTNCAFRPSMYASTSFRLKA